MNADILTPFHKKVLRVFSSLEESRAFYFTGAMALSAYHLHHRVSADIDIFCPEENLIPIVARKLTAAFGREGIERTCEHKHERCKDTPIRPSRGRAF